MKEIELTDEDYNLIASRAVQMYIDKRPKPTRDFVASCYIESFLAHIAAKRYTVIDGKIYANENNKRT